MTTTPTRNLFETCTTIQDLEFRYEIATSPENITMDGERSRTAVQTALAQINRDYKLKRAEFSK